MANIPVTAQLYIWYQQMGHSGDIPDSFLREIFFQVKEASYAGIEGWLAWWGEEERAKQISQLLHHVGLTCPSVYDGGIYHETGAAEETLSRQVQQARTLQTILGIGTLIVDPSPSPQGRKSDEELALECRYLERLRKELATFGVNLAIHNHTPQAADNARELRAIMAGTGVSLGLDIEWLHRAGVEPLSFLREYRTRIGLLHLRNSSGGVWTETLEEGEINYLEVAAILDDHPPTGPLVVELAYEDGTQVTRSIAANLKRSREFVRLIYEV